MSDFSDEDLQTLSDLVLKRLNSMLRRGVRDFNQLLDADPDDFFDDHVHEAMKLQRLGMKLCQRSLNS